MADACGSGRLRVPAKVGADGAVDLSSAGGSDANLGTIEAQGPTDSVVAASGTDGIAAIRDGGASGPEGIGGICGTTTLQTSRAWPDLLVLLDRSSTMDLGMAADIDCVAGVSDCATRWDATKAALLATMQANPRIHWGIELFPSPEGDICGVSPVPQLPIEDRWSGAEPALLNSTTPRGPAPTSAALRSATAYLASLGDQNVRVIMLFTGSEPQCSAGLDGAASDLANTIAAAGAAKAAGFPVYVVGLGPNLSDLDSVARAGGTTSYYPATSRAELDQILGQIYSGPTTVTTCTLMTATPPIDAALVYVYVNGQYVAPNPDDGWTFGANTSTIVLTGSYCEQIVTADSVKIEVFFGCGAISSPP